MKRNIPNAITCCNLISGCLSACFAFYGDFAAALALIIAGAVFDFFDGMTARLLHVSSPIGKELDSLADDITFGLAPAAMVFSFLRWLWPPCVQDGSPAGELLQWLPFLAFVMAAFSALRLAKFNLDERQAMGFIGLPTPANALFWGSLVVGMSEGGCTPAACPLLPWAVLAGTFVSSYLLVSEIPMFALKFKTWGWRGNEVRYGFLASSVPLLLLGSLAAVIAWYVLLSVAADKLKPNRC